MQYDLPVIFDTDRLAAAQRLEYARDVFGRQILRVDMGRVGEQPIHLRLKSDCFGMTRVGVLSSSPISTTRDRKLVADGDGSVGFVIPLAGRYVAGHKGNHFTVVPSQVMALSDDCEGIVNCPSGGSFLTVVMQRKSLLEALNAKTLNFGERLHYTGESLALLQAYIRFVCSNSGHATAADRAIAGRHLVELFALGLDVRVDAASAAGAGSLLAARFAAIHAEIDSHFSATWFSIEVCAAKLGLSVRSVQDICQRNGTSFLSEVRHRRMNLARRMLSDPANRNMRVIDIALDCGYSDISHFNRQFRAAFGDSPSGFRNLPAAE